MQRGFQFLQNVIPKGVDTRGSPSDYDHCEGRGSQYLQISLHLTLALTQGENFALNYEQCTQWFNEDTMGVYSFNATRERGILYAVLSYYILRT